MDLSYFFLPIVIISAKKSSPMTSLVAEIFNVGLLNILYV